MYLLTLFFLLLLEMEYSITITQIVVRLMNNTETARIEVTMASIGALDFLPN